MTDMNPEDMSILGSLKYPFRAALAADPAPDVDAAIFTTELAHRLGDGASPEQSRIEISLERLPR